MIEHDMTEFVRDDEVELVGGQPVGHDSHPFVEEDRRGPHKRGRDQV
jgi:hypothetical protein